MRLHPCADALTRSRRCLVRSVKCCESRPQSEMPLARMLDQRPPHRRSEPMADQQVPEAVRALVEIAHREIREHCAAVARPPLPDGRMGEQFVVAPGVALIELLAAHVLRLED